MVSLLTLLTLASTTLVWSLKAPQLCLPTTKPRTRLTLVVPLTWVMIRLLVPLSPLAATATNVSITLSTGGRLLVKPLPQPQATATPSTWSLWVTMVVV
jgi:hypothetical protein